MILLDTGPGESMKVDGIDEIFGATQESPF